MKRSDALALAGSALVLFPARARADDARPIRVGYSASGESLAQGIYAADGGFFAKAGLTVEMTALSNGGAMTAGIVSGAIDIAPSNVASMSAAYARGLHLDLFAPSVVVLASAPATTIIAVANDSALHTARDFNGKIIGCNTLRDLQQAAVMTWMDKNGGDAKTAQFVEIPNADQLGALATKRIDAACLVEPFLSSATNNTGAVARPYDSLGSTLMTFGWIANHDWYVANPDLVKKVVGALRASARWADANPDKTAAINAKYSGVPAASLMAQHRQVFSDGSLDPALIQPIVDASAHYGFLPKGFPAANLFATNPS
jgi:NitT/TauT family transport system substrate-binding protein